MGFAAVHSRAVQLDDLGTHSFEEESVVGDEKHGHVLVLAAGLEVVGEELEAFDICSGGGVGISLW